MSTPETPPTGEHPVTKAELGRALNFNDVKLIVVAITVAVATAFGAYRVVLNDARAQTGGGIAVFRAEFEAHKKEESAARERTGADVQMLRLEQWEARKELKAFYEYRRTGSPEARKVLEAPLPPPPVPTPPKDGGR